MSHRSVQPLKFEPGLTRS